MQIKDYSGHYNEITRTVLERFAHLNKGSNMVFSPFSVIMLLGIAASSTSGASRSEILKVLGSDLSFEQLMTVLKDLQTTFTEDDFLISSSAVCVQEKIRGSITPGYEDMLRSSFAGWLFASKDIVADVNAWVRENTRGMIDRIADDSMREMPACLINAAAFEAGWLKPYKDRDIDEGSFQNADGTISTVNMLHSQEQTYIENEDFTGFVKPYMNCSCSFMALLPQKESMDSMLQALKNIDFSELLHSLQSMNVFVTMPEFSYSFGQDMTDLCRRMGIKTLFSEEADFTPMSSEWLKADSIIHKAHIEVDRKGTKAVAATAAFIVRAGLVSDCRSVCLDRPFVYAVIHNDTCLPMFCGIMNHAD